MNPYQIISIIVAIAVLVITFLVGVKSDILREAPTPPGGSTPPYSFHKFQLWLWTMVICPAFILYWGYSVDQKAVINVTGLILLGISGATVVTAEVIAATHKSSLGPAALKMGLKSGHFWSDILMDDSGMLSIPRLQQLVFTLIYITVYVATFFKMKDGHFSYPEFDANAFTLMGISTGTYLLGKGLNK